MSFEEQKNYILKKLDEKYPNNKHCILPDPEDDHIFAVRIYDIEDEDFIETKKYIWDIIDSIKTQDVFFVPSIRRKNIGV